MVDPVVPDVAEVSVAALQVAQEDLHLYQVALGRGGLPQQLLHLPQDVHHLPCSPRHSSIVSVAIQLENAYVAHWTVGRSLNHSFGQELIDLDRSLIAGQEFIHLERSTCIWK